MRRASTGCAAQSARLDEAQLRQWALDL